MKKSEPTPAPHHEQPTAAPLVDTAPAPSPAQTFQPIPPAAPAPVSPKKPRTTKRQRLAIVGLVVAFVLATGCGFIGGYLGASARDGSSIADQRAVVSSESQLISNIAKTVGPSVVSVNVVSKTAGSSTGNSFYDYYYGRSQTEASAGTGLILSSDGIIITNRHVVPAGTTNVSVTLSDGTIYKDVQVLGRTSDSDTLDIAFLKIKDTNGKKLPAAKLGDSEKMQVGDRVIAIGNALGQFQNSVTSGIISGYGRSVQAGDDGSSSSSDTENLLNLFQTDAAINPGNSGGPLVNSNGEVIGINVAASTDAQNIGFTIPINDVKGMINQVLKNGSFQRPYIGVRYIPLDSDTASQLQIQQTNGAYIPEASDIGGSSPIVAGGPADKAGLQPKDIIIAVAGTKIDSTHSLSSLLDQHSAGDTIELTILRDNKTMTVKLTLAAAPAN